jgi:ribonuclease-3
MNTTAVRLGYTFYDNGLLTLALTHSSYSRTNNERLEHLGDSILGMVVSEYLYARYPTYSEGQLAQHRARIVCTDNLYRAALALDMGTHLLLGGSEIKSGGRTKKSILANSVEAVIGAIWLDAGPSHSQHSHVTNFIHDHLIGPVGSNWY